MTRHIREQLALGNLFEAERTCRERLAQAPDDATAHFLLAYVLWRTARHGVTPILLAKSPDCFKISPGTTVPLAEISEMNINRISRLPAMLGASLLLCGCVVGQRLVLDAPAAADLAEPHQGHAQVAVDDLREAVVNGEQDPWVIGQYRAALGVPWPVTTEGRIPLAQQIREDLEEALAALGFTPGPGARQLEILIRAWDFTGYQNGRFWYALDIGTRAPDGNPLAGSRLEDEIEIKGTFMLGARGGFERDMPDIYAGIIEAVLRTDPGILESLRQ